MNSYNAPQKYKVIFEDKNGLPYIKKLNVKGEPSGKIICGLKFDSYNMRFTSNMTYDFEVDPDYTDAVILQEEDLFNASEAHLKKATAFKEVTNHNKGARLQLDTDNKIWQYIASLKVGDMIWKSPKSWWIVESKVHVTKDIVRETMSSHGWRSPALVTIKTSTGKTWQKNFYDFRCGTFYHKQPRSYKKEIHDPNL
jgi:hypothetical protein